MPTEELAATPSAGEPAGRMLRLARKLGLDDLRSAGSMYPLAVLFALNVVDELDIAAFAVLAPDIRDAFGLSNATVGTLVAVVVAVMLLMVLPAGFMSDRGDRVRLTRAGAGLWGVFSVLTGLAPALGLLVMARIGAGLGKAVNAPAHRSLLADYYAPRHRAAMYAAYELANPLGKLLAPALIVVLAAFGFGWRVPFVVLAIPTFVVLAASRRLRHPTRGRFEREAAGATGTALELEDEAPALGEAVRIFKGITTLKRLWLSLPFIVGGAAAVAVLSALYYEEVFGLGAGGRAGVSVATEVLATAGLFAGAPVATRLLRETPRRLFHLITFCAFAISVSFVLLAIAPVLAVAVVASMSIGFLLALTVPAIYTLLSMLLPPNARSLGFSVGALFFIPGLIAVPIAGAIADGAGFRVGILVMTPIFLVGGLLLASGVRTVERDIADVEGRALGEVDRQQRAAAGQAGAILSCRAVDAAYGQVQVLFDVDLDVHEGEILALLGTNGAGKSTVLKTVSGLLEPTGGRIVFDGHDVTGISPRAAVELGIVQMPGGRSVFPTLTVGESLRLAGWMYKRSDPAHVARATEQVLDYFPVLRERGDQLAGDLSGGEQQMLGLAMAFISKPSLLMIDELSLGLAPIVVGQLVEIVRRINAAGTTVILVEQSVNVALTLADRAVFMEKGEVRFEGRTAELLERGDLLRSVFLEGANAKGTPAAAVVRERVVRQVGAEPVLRAEGLVKRFGGITATDGVSFDLHRHEILGIIGPNGAGKTTLFDLVSGYLPLDAGRVSLLGQDVTDWQPDRRALAGLARSFQDARLFPSLTVAENLALAFERHLEVRDVLAAALGLPAIADIESRLALTVHELIDLLGLGAFTHKFASELSTGSRRIVDIGMAIAHRPDVLILDEPSSGIAQREAEALGPLLDRIQRELGCSLLLIEHDMPLLLGVSDRVLALETGRKIAEGTPDEVVNDPRVISSYLDTDETVVQRSGGRAAIETGAVVSNGRRRRREPLRAR
jgi:ABC-type branched-subunit amino acid transport system ATPase component/MFS family permease